MKNDKVDQVKRAIREPYAWPGGYPVYTVMADGQLLCAECAKANFRQIVEATKDGLRSGWQAEGCDILYEGEEYCGHCGKVLESAYGESDE